MAEYEVAVCVRTDDHGGWRDGHVVGCSEPGVEWTGAEMAAWLTLDVEPPGLDGLWNADKWREAVKQAKDDTPRRNRDKEKWVAEGCDSNWGRKDLECCAVILMNGTQADIDALQEQDDDGMKLKRVAYENELDAGELSDVREKGKRVKVKREKTSVAAAGLGEPAKAR